MKNLVVILFVFLTATMPLMAQQYQLDSVVHNIKRNQFIASQKYNIKSRTSELIRYERQAANDTIQKIERTQVIYDVKGNELFYILSVWNPIGNTWDEEEKTEQEFDADNRLIRVSSQQKRNNHWTEVFENTRLYAQDSIIETDYEIKDNILQPSNKNISVINASGKVKEHEIFLWNDKEHAWLPLIRTSNIYENDTTLMSYETIEWKDNQWQKQEKVVYALDKNNHPTDNYIQYKEQKNQWIPAVKFEEKEIRESKRKISSTYKWDSADGKWIIQTQVETFCNDEDKKQDVLFSEVDTLTHQLKLKHEQMHFYDKEGRLTLVQNFDHFDEIVSGTQSTVKFDDAGNIIQENEYDFDPENDTWNEKMTTEIVYDKNIILDAASEAHKKFDLFNLNEYNYYNNKHATKQVRIYRYEQNKKILSEEFEYFYSIIK